MLPSFIQREHIGDEWFFDFDRGGWVQMGMEWATPEPEMPPLPEGVVMIDISAGPEAIYNAIADAVGEPRTGPDERPKAVYIRRRI